MVTTEQRVKNIAQAGEAAVNGMEKASRESRDQAVEATKGIAGYVDDTQRAALRTAEQAADYARKRSQLAGQLGQHWLTGQALTPDGRVSPDMAHAMRELMDLDRTAFVQAGQASQEAITRQTALAQHLFATQVSMVKTGQAMLETLLRQSETAMQEWQSITTDSVETVLGAQPARNGAKASKA